MDRHPPSMNHMPGDLWRDFGILLHSSQTYGQLVVAQQFDPQEATLKRYSKHKNRKAWTGEKGYYSFMAASNYTPGNRGCYKCREECTHERPVWIHDCFLFRACGHYVCRSHCYLADCMETPAVLCSRQLSRCTPFAQGRTVEELFAAIPTEPLYMQEGHIFDVDFKLMSIPAG
eukprot:4471214-Amphidinium_carterae.2